MDRWIRETSESGARRPLEMTRKTNGMTESLRGRFWQAGAGRKRHDTMGQPMLSELKEKKTRNTESFFHKEIVVEFCLLVEPPCDCAATSGGARRQALASRRSWVS